MDDSLVTAGSGCRLPSNTIVAEAEQGVCGFDGTVAPRWVRTFTACPPQLLLL
jgi:hypothetical protein